jgi:hypothetical protein
MNIRLWTAGLVALAASAFAQDEEAALKALRTAFKGSDEIDQIDAIKAATGLKNPDAIKLVARGLRSSSYSVREAAMRSLGRTQHPDALKALHKAYRSNKNLAKKSDFLFTLLLKEIARHGDKSSVAILSDSPFRHLTLGNGTARILGLANIKHRSAIDALIKGTSLAGGDVDNRGRTRGTAWQGKFRETFTAALAIMTGQRIGEDFALWRRWWKAARTSFRFDDVRPEVDDKYVRIWEQFWEEPYYPGGKPPEPTLKSPYGRNETPTKEEVDEAVKGLKEAYKDKGEDVRMAAIEHYARVIDPKVIRELARFLADKRTPVRGRAVDALGWSKHPDALKQLHRFYRRNIRELSRDEPELFALLLKSIGRHGDKSSLRVLKDQPMRNLTLASGTARILGAANIRTKEVVNLLVGAMERNETGTRKTRVANELRFLDEFHLALVVLTGEDHGRSGAAWVEWWRKARKTFKISEKRPAGIDAKYKGMWEKYWAESY